VEALVLFSALIWVLVQLFGSRWRRYSHGFFRFFVWAVYTLFTVLGPYTIGLLQEGPFREEMFIPWGTILLLIQVSADSLSVYRIHPPMAAAVNAAVLAPHRWNLSISSLIILSHQ